jgi:hypothetical protein
VRNGRLRHRCDLGVRAMTIDLTDPRLTPLDRKFFDFHEHNPGVYRELVRLARQAKQAGRDRIGVKMIWEVVRWNIFIRTTDEQYKLPNNYHSRYARLIMMQEKDLAGIFELRELRS